MALKTEFIEWGEFLPDLGFFRASDGGVPALVRGSENLLPMHGGLIPARDVEELEDGDIPLVPSTQISQCVAAPLGPVANAWRLIAGNITSLYHYSPASPNVTDVTKLATTYTGNQWFFTVFGDNVVATNGADAVQLLTGTALSAGDRAVDCFTGSGTSTPLFKYLTTYRSHLVGGHYTLSGTPRPNGIWIGATEDVTIMGTLTSHRSLNTTNQILYDDLGAVTGLAAGVDFLLIAREKGWTRMDGPPYGFFTVDPNGGTVYSRSLVMHGNECYFLGGGSVKRMGREGPAVDIGESRVARLLFDPEFSSITLDRASWAGQPARLSVSGAADPHSNTIVWMWTIPGEAKDSISYALTYNTRSQRFGILRLTDSDPGTLLRTWGGICTMPPRADQAWYPLQNLAFILQRELTDPFQGFAQFVATRLFTCAAATGYFAHASETEFTKARYTSLRPIYSVPEGKSAPTVSITTYSTDVPYSTAPVTATSWTLNPDDGRFYPKDDHPFAEFQRMLVRFGNETDGLEVPVSEFEGVEAEIEFSGRRG